MCELLKAEVAHRAQWKRRGTLLSCLTFMLKKDSGFLIQKSLLTFINSGYKSYGVVRIPDKRKFSVRFLANADSETKVQDALVSMDPSKLHSLKFGFLLLDGETVFVWTISNGRDLIEATLTGSIKTLRQNGWPIRAAVGRVEDLFEVEKPTDRFDLMEMT